MERLVLRARRITQATPRTRIISVALAEHPFPFHAGQAVFAGLADSAVRRPYSISCSPGQSRRERMLELLVQIDDHEPPDPHLERAEPGTALHIEGPFGSFALPAPRQGDHLLLIAGGTGIAPLRSMMWDVLEKQGDTRISLVYSARGAEEFAYRDELQSLAARGTIDLLLTVTRDVPTEWTGASGRISGALLAPVLTPSVTRCLICGPSGLVSDAAALLKTAGIPAERILTETYAA